MLDTAGKLILPYGSFSEKFQRHGTGDGYYVILDTIPPVVVLEFVNRLSNEIEEHNKNFGPGLPMQFRCVLGFGSVETVGDQLFGTVLSDAERLISDEIFKDYQNKSGKNLALFLTNLFHLKLQKGIQEDKEFERLHHLEWTRCEVKDKHEKIHIGYLLGKYQVPETPDKKISQIEWQTFLNDETIVFLMGFHNIGLITSKLMSLGKAKDYPCAVISKGSTPEQQVVVSTLENITEDSKGLPTPAIIVVGEVVKLREKIKWFK